MKTWEEKQDWILRDCDMNHKIIKEYVELILSEEVSKSELARLTTSFEELVKNPDQKSKIRPALQHMVTPQTDDDKPADFIVFGHVLVDILHSEDVEELNKFCALLKQMATARKKT